MADEKSGQAREDQGKSRSGARGATINISPEMKKQYDEVTKGMGRNQDDVVEILLAAYQGAKNTNPEEGLYTEEDDVIRTAMNSLLHQIKGISARKDAETRSIAEEMEQKLQEKQTELDRSTNLLNGVTAEKQELEKNIKILKEQLAEEKKSMNEASKQMTDKDGTIEELKAACKDARARAEQYDDERKQIPVLKQQLEDLRGDKIRLVNEAKTDADQREARLMEELDQANATITTQKETIIELRQALEAEKRGRANDVIDARHAMDEALIAQDRRHQEALKAEWTAATAREGQLRAEVDAGKETRRTLEDQLKEADWAHREAIASAEDEKRVSKIKADQLQDKVTKLEAELANANAELEALRTKLLKRETAENEDVQFRSRMEEEKNNCK